MMGKTPTARACGACGGTFTGRAGRVVNRTPVCKPCGSRLRPTGECAACRGTMPRPRRKTDTGALCRRCSQRDSHATCRACRRHRKVAGRDGEGRPLCAGCAAAVPAKHSCPDCQTDVPGSGATPCRACTFKRLVARRVAECAAIVEPAWGRALFEAFGAWPGLARDNAVTIRGMDAYARFFADLGAACGGPEEVIQARLLALFGNEGLRRRVVVVRFLSAHLALAWDQATADAAVEARRIEAAMAAHADRAWIADLRAFHAHLAESAVRPRTVRMYLAAAAGLLAASGVERAVGLRQAHVRRHLRGRAGRRVGLVRFASWLAATGGNRLLLGAKRRPSPRRRERKVLRTCRALLRTLARATDPRQGRALVAAVISAVHHVPLSRVLALRRTDVATTGERTSLWTGDEEVTLGGPIAAGFERFGSTSGALVFPGRNPVQPLSPTSVARHTRPVTKGKGEPS